MCGHVEKQGEKQGPTADLVQHTAVHDCNRQPNRKRTNTATVQDEIWQKKKSVSSSEGTQTLHCREADTASAAAQEAHKHSNRMCEIGGKIGGNRKSVSNSKVRYQTLREVS
jgi:hypothetical protein